MPEFLLVLLAAALLFGGRVWFERLGARRGAQVRLAVGAGMTLLMASELWAEWRPIGVALFFFGAWGAFQAARDLRRTESSLGELNAAGT